MKRQKNLKKILHTKNISRRIGEFKRGKIESVEYMKKKIENPTKPVKGARTVFTEKYKLTGNFESAKKELIDQGFSTEIFDDNILKNWIDIDEGR